MFSDGSVTRSSCPRCGARLSRASHAGLCPACLLAAAFSGADEGEPDDLFPTLQPGTAIGPFRVLGVLGKGGMATVYKAEEVRLERIVALKILPPQFLHQATFAQRFEREARVVARLEHPNIVPLYATGIDDGIPWMSMRLLAGGNLGTLLEHHRPETRDAVRMLRSVADALDYAHSRGIVHRDVKPTNILLDGSDHVCLGDFGLAHLLEGEGGITRTGTLIGTPHYMAPEQALGEPVDHRCDIYSLGIVAYEMFVGAPPFAGESPMAVLLKHVNEPLPTVPDNRVSEAVLHAIRRAVTKTPAERWPAAGAFVSALEAATGLTQPVMNASVRRDARHGAIRWRLGGAVVAIGAFALAATGVWWPPRERERDPQTVVSPVLEQPSEASPAEVVMPVVSEPTTQTDLVDAPATAPPRSSADEKSAAPEAIPPPLIAVPSRPPLHVPLPTAPEAVPPPASKDVPVPAKPAQQTQAVAEDTVTPPVRKREVSPEYPAPARAAQLEGDVLLEAVVGADGKVHDVTVLQSVHPLIDDAAKAAVLKYEYTPGRRNGTPEAARVRIMVSFRLR